MQLRGNGLFLCSNRVTLEHPYYNTPVGRTDFESLWNKDKFAREGLWKTEDGTVMVTVEIPIPDKFNSVMRREEERFNILTNE